MASKQIKDLTLEEIFKNCKAWEYDCEYCDLNIRDLCPQKVFSGLRSDIDLTSYMEMNVVSGEEGSWLPAPSKLNDMEKLLLKVFSNADYIVKNEDCISFWQGTAPIFSNKTWHGDNWIGGIKRSDLFKSIPDGECRKVCYLRETGTL